jgi:hypothetical protein
MKIQVFDPPMCCSTGICGPSVDPKLVRFAADLDWLKRQGVDVERNNLSQQPAAFAGTPAVMETLKKHGNECLPLTLADGKVVCEGQYPTREMLAGFAGLGSEAARESGSEAQAPCCCCGGSAKKEEAPASGKAKKKPCCC